MTWFPEVIHGGLGWCPNARSPNTQAPCRTAGRQPIDIADPDPRPGTSASALAVPHWMTTAALVILFATFFVGGNLWWPVFVFTVLAIFLIIHIRTVQNQRRA